MTTEQECYKLATEMPVLEIISKIDDCLESYHEPEHAEEKNDIIEAISGNLKALSEKLLPLKDIFASNPNVRQQFILDRATGDQFVSMNTIITMYQAFKKYADKNIENPVLHPLIICFLEKLQDSANALRDINRYTITS